MIEQKFPWLIEEMRGYAEGLEMPFDHILALNCRVEFLHLTKHIDEIKVIGESEIEGLMECSDFSLINKQNVNKKTL